MRTCKKCHTTKPLSEFPPSGNGVGALRHECRECYRKTHRGYYLANRKQRKAKAERQYRVHRERMKNDPEYRARKLERRSDLNSLMLQKLRSKVLDHYGRECECCGENTERLMTIDHANNDGHLVRSVQGTGSTFYRWLIRNKFPDGFQVLCFNCNIGRALNGGTCPHQEGPTTRAKARTAKRREARSPVSLNG